MRANIVVAVGVVGEEEDLKNFLELCRADFEHRCVEIAEVIMGGRVTILPLKESFDATEDESNTGGSGEGVLEDGGGERDGIYPIRGEFSSEEAQSQDEPGPDAA